MVRGRAALAVLLVLLAVLAPPREAGAVVLAGESRRRAGPSDPGRRLARKEGLLVGCSAGANVAAVLRLLANPHEGGTVACVLCDSGTKYLSTESFVTERDEDTTRLALS